jgi:hypothetical protein
MSPLKMKFVSAGDVPRLVEQMNEKLSYMRHFYKICTTIEIYNDRESPVIDEYVTILSRRNGTPHRPLDELPLAKYLIHQIFIAFNEKLRDYQKKAMRTLTFKVTRLACGAQGVELVSDEPRLPKSGSNTPTFIPSRTDL